MIIPTPNHSVLTRGYRLEKEQDWHPTCVQTWALNNLSQWFQALGAFKKPLLSEASPTDPQQGLGLVLFL